MNYEDAITDKTEQNDHVINESVYRSGNGRLCLPEPVYYINSPTDDTVLVGLDVVIKKEKGVYMVSWWDPSHQRCMTAAKIMKNSDFFAFKRSEREGGHLYFFTPLDLETYNIKVKNHLIGGRNFKSKEEMIQAFLDIDSD